MDLNLLLQQLGDDRPGRLPPVEKWQPSLSGDMDMVIRKDGSWWHEGAPVKREKLVRLFASILRKEGDDYFLLTPVEKWRIRVEDRPLLITMLERRGDTISMVTATGDLLELGTQHPLQMSELDGTLLPEVRVRQELWARLSRNAWYDLLELAEESADGDVVVRSAGVSFVLS